MGGQPRTYPPTAIGLHWTMAVLISTGFILGLIMADMTLSPTKLRLYSYHKWIGMSALFLALLRWSWRLTHQPPSTGAEAGGRLARKAAHAAHWILYLLMVAIPLTGWLMSSAKGFQTVMFGVLPLPDLVGKDSALGQSLAQAHTILNDLMACLVGGHIAAALVHHLLLGDQTLRRMLPGLRGRTPPPSAR